MAEKHIFVFGARRSIAVRTTPTQIYSYTHCTVTSDMHRHSFTYVYKKITFQITEGVNTPYTEQHLDDYDCEESFRLLINTFRGEYENDDESDEEEKKSIDTKEIITKLQEFEEIIDEDVKEKVSENVYKVMLEKLHEVYKIVK